jgi:hypothetical protein
MLILLLCSYGLPYLKRGWPAANSLKERLWGIMMRFSVEMLML